MELADAVALSHVTTRDLFWLRRVFRFRYKLARVLGCFSRVKILEFIYAGVTDQKVGLEPADEPASGRITTGFLFWVKRVLRFRYKLARVLGNFNRAKNLEFIYAGVLELADELASGHVTTGNLFWSKRNFRFDIESERVSREFQPSKKSEIYIRGCVGTGRRAGFRCQCPQGRVGSNPTTRTNIPLDRFRARSF